MATSHFQPESFDTDFRLVLCSHAKGQQVYQVSCFEYYGPAAEAWLDVDEQVRAGKLDLVDYQLLDPMGRELLRRDSHFTREPEYAAGLEPGVYVFDEAGDRYVAFDGGLGD